MTKLPFKTTTQKPEKIITVTGDMGELKFLSLGYVRVKEDAEINNQLYKQSEVALKAQQVVFKIMKDSNLTRQEVAQFMDDPEGNPELAAKHMDDLNSLISLQDSIKVPQYQVLCAIHHRLIKDEDFDASGNVNTSTIGMPEATLSDLLELDKNTFNGILMFMQDEMNGREEEVPLETKPQRASRRKLPT